MAKPSKNKEKLLLLRRNPLTTRTIFCYSSPLNRNVCEYKVCGRKQAFFVFFSRCNPKRESNCGAGRGGGGYASTPNLQQKQCTRRREGCSVIAARWALTFSECYNSVLMYSCIDVSMYSCIDVLMYWCIDVLMYWWDTWYGRGDMTWHDHLPPEGGGLKTSLLHHLNHLKHL